MSLTKEDKQFLCRLMLIVLGAVRLIVEHKVSHFDWWTIERPQVGAYMRDLIEGKTQVNREVV